MTDRTPDDLSTRPSGLDAQPLHGGGEVQDFEIDGGVAPASDWEPESETPSKLPWVLALIGLLLILAAGFWWFRGRDAPQPPSLGSAPSRPLDAPGEENDVVEPEDETDFGDVPALDESDPWFRQVVAELSSHPKLAEWLLTEDLLRTGVKVVSNVAYGEDPRVHVGFLKPRGAFDVAGDVPSSRSFARYDLLAEVFASLDPEGTAALYREIAPRAQEAFEELGYPGSFDRALRDALAALDAVPVSDRPTRLVRETLSYHYADPELEALEPAQKLLLRMGPANQVKVQSQLAAVREALGL